MLIIPQHENRSSTVALAHAIFSIAIMQKISTNYNNVSALGNSINDVRVNTAVDLFALQGQVPALLLPH